MGKARCLNISHLCVRAVREPPYTQHFFAVRLLFPCAFLLLSFAIIFPQYPAPDLNADCSLSWFGSLGDCCMEFQSYFLFLLLFLVTRHTSLVTKTCLAVTFIAFSSLTG